MAFQVKEFDSIQKGVSIEWKFKLINKSTSQFNFYELDSASRTLLNLANDMTCQLDAEIQNKKKKSEGKNRCVRKVCQKIIKSLRLSLTSFANDIDQQLGTVKAFFNKEKLPEHKVTTLMEKCKRWSLSAWVGFLAGMKLLFRQIRPSLVYYYQTEWNRGCLQQSNGMVLSSQTLIHSPFIILSLQNHQFFNSTERYIQSYIKDGRRVNPEFDINNELYGVIIGEKGHREIQEEFREHENLIQIDVNLTINSKYISECLLYNTDNLSYIKTRNFSEHFVNDLLKQNNIQGMDKETIQQLEQEVRIQIRSQCLYKTLLKKYAHILLNFSTIEIPSEAREYLIPIELKLKNDEGEIQYQDYFQWDILNESNSIQQFSEQLIEDTGLDPKYFSQLCYKIRTQINAELQWKFMLLVKTYKQIHKDRESPKLNTQTTAIIRKNLPYAMDVSMLPENKSYKPPENLVFTNSDVFSLISRNMDILPQEFQSFLLQKEGGKDSMTKTEDLIQKTQVTTSSKSRKVRNLSEEYEKKGIKVESNPYLSGVSNIQTVNVWKKLMDQKTTCNQ